MKKAVALLGTQRRQNTFRLLGEIGEILAKHGIALEVIELYRYDIQFCAGCDRCILNGECVWKDGAEELMERLAEADGVILASPVYLQQVSGKLKTFLDRTCRWYHRPVLTGKPMLAVASTKGSGLKKTLSYLESIAVQWGAMPAGKVGRTIFNQDRKISEREVERFVRLMEQPERYSPSLGQMIDFEVQKSMALFLGKLDRAYWEEKGWVDRPYYFPCRIHRPYALISRGIGGLIRSKMKGGRKEDPTHP